tara:strand:- start:402 stop:1082 length:681 start_codon:yes stop_codon:yes gene_type:complete
MTNQKFKLDLLSNRRKEFNSKKVTYSQIKKQKKRGYLYGLIVSCSGFLICSLALFHTYQRIKYKEKLEIEAFEYQSLKSIYQENIKRLRTTYQLNNQIAQGIVGIRSGSALLLEFRKIIPTSIQLNSIEAKGLDLVINGVANQPYALDSINSFKLLMSNSFLVKNESVFLSRAWEVKKDKINLLNFKFNSSFSKPSSKLLKDNYERLGSIGLLKRVNLLKEEGLIK